MTEKGTLHLQLSDTDRETLQQALQQLHHFLELYSEEDMQQRCWELLSCALGSEEADTWTHFDRSNMLLFYKEWTKLGGMLFAVNKSFKSIKL